MTSSKPIDPRVRLAISQWPDDAPRGAVTTFCAEHGISRKSFYVLRRRCIEEGPAAVLAPRTRRPRTSPSKLSDELKQRAVQVRASLAASGLDHGLISVHDRMHTMGLHEVPSVASLARIFREAGVARSEPRKKPRSAWRRFVYPAPNACWQLDATEYVLTGGRRCTIFQLIDDHSRYAVASHVADGETSDAAVIVFDKAVAAHGVPQRLLTDNGAAFNTSRRGLTSKLVAHVSGLGVEAITGKPYKPTTQGKNERFHQTLFRYLDKQPLAESLDQLQHQVDTFDRIYNTERPHQGLPGRVTPLVAWETTPKAEAPRPRGRPTYFAQPPTRRSRISDPAEVIRTRGITYRALNSIGTFRLDGVTYMVSAHYRYETVLILAEEDNVIVTSVHGEVLAEHTRPPAGATYVGNGRPKGRWRDIPDTSPNS
ncbi:integrase core domain-containing protein [Cnuibacter physcomitrellae]|uniref:integrase core domain-containing protein n=1 Tax=Cnuibacter physcomitrellae TaxID=1619308 RepID=UPI004047C558